MDKLLVRVIYLSTEDGRTLALIDHRPRDGILIIYSGALLFVVSAYCIFSIANSFH